MTGEQFRARRKRLGLSQRQLGERLGVDRQTVARWERGEVRIRHPRILALAFDALEAAALPAPDTPETADAKMGAIATVLDAMRTRGVLAVERDSLP